MTATRTSGATTCSLMPAMVRSAQALTSGFISDKSFWKMLMERRASFWRLEAQWEERSSENYIHNIQAIVKVEWWWFSG